LAHHAAAGTIGGMLKLQAHLRNTFLAGIFSIVPVAVTVYIVYQAESVTREIFHGTPLDIPFIGIVLAIVALYLAGLIVSSLIGKWVLKWVDRALSRVPGLNTLYESWKHISLTPDGTEGTFSKVVLVPADTGLQIGFTSGVGIPGDDSTWCVFIPSAPNPITGRMYFVKRDRCTVLDCSAEDAFKTLISTGNYVAPTIGAAIK
jgi:uncharacterized membrane protein